MDSDIEFLSDEDYSDYEYTNEGDDISLDGLILDNEQNKTEVPKFEILSPQEIVHEMLNFIKEVNMVVEIPATTTRLLLHHFNWDKEKLMERYYDDDQEKLFEEARVINPFKIDSLNETKLNEQNDNDSSDKSVEHEDCGVCFIPTPISELSGLKCGHKFCLDCWNDYLKTKIQDGQAENISCASHDCNILVDDMSVTSWLKDPKIQLKYRQFITNSFVECNKFLRWCPTPNCNHAVKVNSLMAREITCKCDSKFCFDCGEVWHELIDCKMLRIWNKQLHSDSEDSAWLSKNTKECPSCTAKIEKNGGCNYVTCRKCRQQFCWLCRCPTIGYSPHKCYNDEDEEAPSKEMIERYWFYTYRFKNHQKSLKLEKSMSETVSSKIEEMHKQGNTWDVQFLKTAVDVLNPCRQTLMYTYAFSYFLKKNNQKQIFEDNQNDLENSVETLSGHLEDVVANGHTTEMKQKIQDMTRYCENRRKVLLEHYNEGNDNDWWEFNI